MGYHRAGFEVVGVDIKPQPYYPFEFHLADALEYPLEEFDVIHASPPCQAYSSTRHLPGTNQYPDLIEPVRRKLDLTGLPWIIENVPGAPMRQDVVLCGSMFEMEIRRHRWFEFGRITPMDTPKCDHSDSPRFIIAGHPGGTRKGKPVGSTEEWRQAMGTPWMRGWDISEAIPPVYTEYIGKAIMEEHFG